MLTLNLNPFPILHTERLTLRQITHNDTNEIFMLRSDHRVMKYVDRPMPKLPEDVTGLIQKMIDGINNNDSISWAISLQSDPELIGMIGFWRIEKENYRAEIGYMLHPDYQGKGIMQEAMTAVLDYGFNVMKLHSVEANVNPANEASIRLLGKNKFEKEAYFKEDFYFQGKFLDSAIYSLLTSDR